MSFAELRTLVDQGKAGEVDRTLQGYLDTQNHDAAQQGLMDDVAFDKLNFESTSPVVRATIDTWKHQLPKSAFALAASGWQYVGAAQEARGSGYASGLTEAQVAGMRQYLILARDDLDAAANIQPSITITYGGMIVAGSMFGDRQYEDEAANIGLGVDPLNFRIRALWMSLSDPAWGGSEAMQQQQAQDALALAPRNPLLRLVASSAQITRYVWAGHNDHVASKLLPAMDDAAMLSDLEDAANTAFHNNAPHLAIELYSEVIRFSPTEADPLRWRANLLRTHGDSAWGIGSVALASRRAPENDQLGLALGLTYASNGYVREAESTFQSLIARNADNQKAIASLGDLYSHEGHQPDKAMALADQLIRRHPDNPDGYVVRSCVQMDNNLPGRYETIHYFLDHFANLPGQEGPVAHMRAYLKNHPEPAGAG